MAPFDVSNSRESELINVPSIGPFDVVISPLSAYNDYSNIFSTNHIKKVVESLYLCFNFVIRSLHRARAEVDPGCNVRYIEAEERHDRNKSLNLCWSIA